MRAYIRATISQCDIKKLDMLSHLLLAGAPGGSSNAFIASSSLREPVSSRRFLAPATNSAADTGADDPTLPTRDLCFAHAVVDTILQASQKRPQRNTWYAWVSPVACAIWQSSRESAPSDDAGCDENVSF